ncbi:hypothetical protein Tco_0519882 [Tanacetum coccineum]
MLTSTKLKSSANARRSQPLGNTKNNRILPPTSSNMKNKVEEHPRSIKSKSNKMNRVVEPICSSSKSKIIESRISNTLEPNQSWGSIALDVPSSSSLVDFRLSRLFSGTIRFDNNQIAKIMGYGDYQLGNVTISLVYYVEGLGKSKKHSYKPKAKDFIKEKLYLLHMDDEVSFYTLFQVHSCQPPYETRILSVVLEITPNLATRATEIPLSSPYGTIWYLFDPTPFGWCKTDAHSMNFGLRSEIQNQNLKDFLKLVDSLDLDCKTPQRYPDVPTTSWRISLKAWTRFKGSLTPKKSSSWNQQNRNPSSPKCVHFVNSIVILNKEDKAKEKGNMKTITTEYEDHKMTIESEEETEEEIEEEEEEDSPKHFDIFPTMKELRYHKWLLKNPRPPWVKAKVRIGNLKNVQFSYMIGHFDKKQAYLDIIIAGS